MPFGTQYSSKDIYPVHSTAAGSYTLEITQTDANNCTSAKGEAVFRINPKPGLPSIPTVDNCEGSDPRNIRVSGEQFAGFRWYESQAHSAVFTTGNSVLAKETDAGMHPYYAAQINSHGCLSDVAVGYYHIKPSPAIPQVFPATSCEGEYVQPLVATHSADYVDWYNPQNGARLEGKTNVFTPDYQLLRRGTVHILMP
jgi:hypothetical protein